MKNHSAATLVTPSHTHPHVIIPLLPAPSFTLIPSHQVHKSDLQAAVKLGSRSVRPDLVQIFAAASAQVCACAGLKKTKNLANKNLLKF